MTTVDKQAVKDWDEFHKSLSKDLVIDNDETGQDKLKRIAGLEADPETWFKYYFPKYATAKPALFHCEATERIIKNSRWFEVRMWSRELAKSTRTMMEVLYLVLAKKELKNVLMISNSEDNAERLLLPYKINLEENPRIINDYGLQKNPGSWTSYEFITRKGTSFRAVGAGQSPRGTRFENYRVDCILIDDIDTDEECRNEELVKKKFDWFQEAVIPTVSVSGQYRIIICGNLISKNCVVAYSMKLAHYVDKVNIRGEDGLSSWPEKNSEEDIDAILGLLTFRAQQKEYFNNPIVVGTVFEKMSYKVMRPLKDYKFLVCYTDPSYKSSNKNDYKATVLVGKWQSEFHVIKAYCDQTSTANMIDWHYQIDAFVNNRVPVYYFMESNFMQDNLIKEFWRESVKRDKVIPLKGDTRKKDDKFTRIEVLLEPLNRNGQLYLNIAEKDNKNMQNLDEQFVAISPTSKAHDDAPDAVEGAVFIINNKKQLGNQGIAIPKNKKKNSKKY